MRSRRLQLVAVVTFEIPETTEISHGLSPVLHKSLHVFLQPFKSIVFALVEAVGAGNFTIDFYSGCLSTLPIFYFLPQLFVFLKVAWSSRFDNHRPKVIEYQIVNDGHANGNPHEAEEDAQPPLEDASYHGEECVDVH